MEVAEILDDAMQPHPDMGTGISAIFLGERFFMMLNVDAIFREDQEKLVSIVSQR